ncbi:MAG: PKD domain-containing protein [Candidatus Verstraetearchaeota archaeon]|nr:PKD domain-containing protein [Candidatus Verstraetearchaeota archaeon]
MAKLDRQEKEGGIMRNTRTVLLLGLIILLLGLAGCLFQPPHTVSTPNTPAGPSSGEVGQSLTFSTGGASCSRGHSVEYRFDWGDGTYSSWSSSWSASHTWSASGTYQVRAQARCEVDTSIVSPWSSARTVSITTPSVSYRVTVGQIVAEFEANEYAATEKYKGKTIAVSGYVREVGVNDFTDEPFVDLQERPDDTAFDPSVVCYFTESGPHPGLSELRKGDYATIVGEFWSYSSLFETVYLKNSYVE